MTPDELVTLWTEQAAQYRHMRNVYWCKHVLDARIAPRKDDTNRTAPYYLAMDGREHEAGEFAVVLDWRVTGGN